MSETKTYENKRAAITGFAPETLDLSGFPGLTPEMIRADLEEHANQLRSVGVDARVYYFDPSDFSSTAQFAEDLRALNFNVVEIGAGIRKLPPFLVYFEQLVNLVHANAPSTKFCFNNQPDDTATAILRWL
jgi:hypothetical protein